MRENRKDAKLESELVWLANHGATLKEIEEELGLTAAAARRIFYVCQERGWIYTRSERVLQEGRYILFLLSKGKTEAQICSLLGITENEYRSRRRAAKDKSPRSVPPASLRTEELENKLVRKYIEKAEAEGLCSSDETVANRLTMHPYRVAIIRGNA